MRRYLVGIVLLPVAAVALACVPVLAAADGVEGQAGPGEQAEDWIRLRVRPRDVEFDLSEPPGLFPPAPGQPVPVYVAPSSRPAFRPAATVEIRARGVWRLYIQANGTWGVEGLEVGDLFIAPRGTPRPSPGAAEPPWPWMALSTEPRLLSTGEGDAELAFDLELRIHGDEAPAKKASLTLTYTLLPDW